MNELPLEIVTDVVQRMAGDASLRVTSCSTRPIGYASVSPHSRGLFHVEGRASRAGEPIDWSLVLKVIRPPDLAPADEQAQPFYWRREALAYQSGLLPHRADGLAAPACFGVTERPDGSIWLWLEQIGEPEPASWALPRFALAASHLGAFGGSRSLPWAIPSAPWLSRGLLRAWVADSASLIDSIQDTSVWEHPLLRDTVFASVADPLLQLWDQREGWFQALEQLPQTLCHHDVWRKNLIARDMPGARRQTVALDWEVVGLGAVGEDLGNLIGVSLLNLDVGAREAPLFAATMLDSYVGGLQGAGWRGDQRILRATAQATAALRCAFSTGCWPAAILRSYEMQAQYIQESEQRWGRPIEAIFAQWAATTTFLLAQAAEARAVLGL